MPAASLRRPASTSAIASSRRCCATSGIRRLDYLALTHGDPDHIGGAASIVDEFRPREVWEGIPVPPFAPLTALRMHAQAAGARWANVYRGDHVGIDGVEVRAAHPGRPEWERQKVRNDDSLVLDLRWRDVSVLLTGDIWNAGRADARRVGARPRATGDQGAASRQPELVVAGISSHGRSRRSPS